MMVLILRKKQIGQGCVCFQRRNVFKWGNFAIKTFSQIWLSISKKNPLYFRMFQVSATLCLNMKVDFKSQDHDSDLIPFTRWWNPTPQSTQPSLLTGVQITTKVKTKENLEICMRLKTVLIFFIGCFNLLFVLQFFRHSILNPFVKQA